MNHSPSGRVGLSGPERANPVCQKDLMREVAKSPSPAATASDPPEGWVLQVTLSQRLVNCTTAEGRVKTWYPDLS